MSESKDTVLRCWDVFTISTVLMFNVSIKSWIAFKRCKLLLFCVSFISSYFDKFTNIVPFQSNAFYWSGFYDISLQCPLTRINEANFAHFQGWVQLLTVYWRYEAMCAYILSWNKLLGEHILRANILFHLLVIVARVDALLRKCIIFVCYLRFSFVE